MSPIHSPAVQFIYGDAAQLNELVPVGIDRILCNAAFFHFPDPRAVLTAAGQILSEKGRFLFNIPDQDFDFGDGVPSGMARLVAERLNQPFDESQLGRYSYTQIQKLATNCGFELEDFTVLNFPLLPEDVIGFYSIPHVGARRLPELSTKDRRRALEQAFADLPPEEMPQYRWAQFIVAPRGS